MVAAEPPRNCCVSCNSLDGRDVVDVCSLLLLWNHLCGSAARDEDDALPYRPCIGCNKSRALQATRQKVRLWMVMMVVVKRGCWLWIKAVFTIVRGEEHQHKQEERRGETHPAKRRVLLLLESLHVHQGEDG